MSSPAVVVVGSINMDLVTSIERLPAPGETVSGGRFREHHGGKGGNQAVAAARLGARSIVVGMVGDDDYGVAARAELEREGVVVEHILTGNEPTGIAQIVVDSAGENLIAVAPGANRELTAELVIESLGRVDAGRAVVLAVLEIPKAAVIAAAAGAQERNWPFVLNPAPARTLPDDLLSACAVITPNEHEVTQLGRRSPEELLDAGVGTVVVTKGASGVDVWRHGKPLHHQPAFEVNVVDTTGAGDAFSGALAWALADGRGIEEAVELGAAAGALAACAAGAREGMASVSELEELIAGR